MLVSHRHKFIFTKTQKTAGTSVESYFEKYCMFDDEWAESHFRDEYNTKAGTIGYRGYDRGASIWYNHMSAETIRNLLGEGKWRQYFKFTVIRNPFDKMISGFSMLEARNQVHDKTLKQNGSGKLDSTSEIIKFRQWVKNGGIINDRDVYLIDGQECLDYFIRYEDLYNGINHVCSVLDLTFQQGRLPEFKKGLRSKHIPIAEYYDMETREIIERKFAWEIDRFNYSMPEQ